MISWLHQLSMLELLAPPDRLTWNAPSWSISAEMFAYIILFPMYAWLIGRDRRLWKAAILFAIGILGVMSIANINGRFSYILPIGGMLRIILEFAMGVGLYTILSHFDNTRKYWNLFTVFGLFSFVVLAINYQSILTSSIPYINDSLFFIAGIFIVIGGYNSTGPLSAILSSKPLFI